jgi:hypothetical protein
LTQADDEVVRARQKSRARLMAVLLGAFAVLLFFVTVAKIGINW